MSLSPELFQPVKSQTSAEEIARPSTTLWQDASL
jgi:hypothetical protein